MSYVYPDINLASDMVTKVVVVIPSQKGRFINKEYIISDSNQTIADFERKYCSQYFLLYNGACVDELDLLARHLESDSSIIFEAKKSIISIRFVTFQYNFLSRISRILHTPKPSCNTVNL